MSINFSCQCGQKLTAKADAAGKRVKCPKCGSVQEVPPHGSTTRTDESNDQAALASSDKPGTIAVVCTCGKQLKAPANMEGKQARCPKCRKTISIPSSSGSITPAAGMTAAAASSPLDDLLDDVGMAAPRTPHFCPECKADMAPDAVLCIQCGFNLQLGNKIETELDPALQADSDLPPEIRKVMREVREAQQEVVAEGNEGASAWILGIALFAGVAVFIAVGIMISRFAGGGAEGVEGDGSQFLAQAMLWLSQGMMFCASVWLLAIAFKDQILHGVLMLVCGPYGLVYAIMHWDACKGAVGLHVAGIILFIMSIFGSFG